MKRLTSVMLARSSFSLSNVSVSFSPFQINWILFCATLWCLRTTLANMRSGVSHSKDTRFPTKLWRPLQRNPTCGWKSLSSPPQGDSVQDCGPVCHTGLYLDSGALPDKLVLSSPLYNFELPAGHLPLHRPLSAEQRGTFQIDNHLSLFLSFFPPYYRYFFEIINNK